MFDKKIQLNWFLEILVYEWMKSACLWKWLGRVLYISRVVWKFHPRELICNQIDLHYSIGNQYCRRLSSQVYTHAAVPLSLSREAGEPFVYFLPEHASEWLITTTWRTVITQVIQVSTHYNNVFLFFSWNLPYSCFCIKSGSWRPLETYLWHLAWTATICWTRFVLYKTTAYLNWNRAT